MSFLQTGFHLSERLSPRILGGIRKLLRLIVSDVLDAEILHNLEHQLAAVSESNCAVVRISLLNQNMAIESAHFGDSKYCDTAEGTGRNVEDFALCNVAAELALGIALKSVEGDFGRSDVALEGTSCEVRLAALRL